MPTTFLNALFDGSTNVNTLNGTQSWFDRFLGYYSQYEENANNNLVANVTLTGANWTVATMRFGDASEQSQLNLIDANGFANRTIQYLQLGYNSDVDLTSTRVWYMIGFEGDLHDITLGSARVNSIDLYADRNVVTTGSGTVGHIDTDNGTGIFNVNGFVGRIDASDANDILRVFNTGEVDSAYLRGGNDTVLVNGSGRISNLTIFGGNNTVTVRDQGIIDELRLGSGDNTVRNVSGDARIRYVKFTEGDNTLFTAGYMETFNSWQSNNTIQINGGAGSLTFNSDTMLSHVVTATSYIESLRVNDRGNDPNDDQTTRLTFTDGGGAGSIYLGSGNDRVVTDGYVDYVNTSRGNDIITIGSGGMGHLSMGDGNDLARFGGFDNTGNGVVIWGGAGIDTIDFARVPSIGVTFSLDVAGQWQNVGAPGGGLDETPAVGWVSVSGIENVVGTLRRDHLTGNRNNNDLNGRGGLDTIHGGEGDDILRGQFGGDELYGESGSDTIFGGVGTDTIVGGADNDNLSGAEDADIFVFGANSGFDQIRDFEDGTDIIRIADHAGGFGTLNIFDRGDNLRVDHDGGQILLIGYAGTVLTAADFDFV